MLGFQIFQSFLRLEILSLRGTLFRSSLYLIMMGGRFRMAYGRTLPEVALYGMNYHRNVGG